MANNLQPTGSDDTKFAQPLYTPIKRRSFFMYAGATAGATALVLAGCGDDDDDTVPVNTISLGSGNVGVLNYAYALEQLEAAFYAKVVSDSASAFPVAAEFEYFRRVAAHEAIHRDFFKAAITRDAPTQILQGLTPDFSKVTFTNRTSVLATAMAFEDLGVAAYNGAGKLITTAGKGAEYLLLAGKIASVEARHAAYIRDLVTPGSFAADNQVDVATGLDKAMTPVEVIAVAQAYITQKLDASSVGK